MEIDIVFVLILEKKRNRFRQGIGMHPHLVQLLFTILFQNDCVVHAQLIKS
jgi:hypothetical protein